MQLREPREKGNQAAVLLEVLPESKRVGSNLSGSRKHVC